MLTSPEPAQPRPTRHGLGQPLLVVDAVVKRFGGQAAVDGMSFSVEAGEIVGLVGPNGAGKTTMFDCLAGKERPTSGRITLAGRAIEGLPAHARMAQGLGRTFQIPRPFHSLSVLDNTILGAQGQHGETAWMNWLRPGTVRRQERDIADRAMALLEFTTLAPLARQPARVLSGGQRKLLELARALMANPKLLLLDEPAAGVAPLLLDLVIDRIAAIRERGVTLLLIEHNMDMVARLCTRVLVMAQGTLLAEGTPAAVVSDPAVVDAYLGAAA